MKSVMKRDMSRTPSIQVPRSRFNRSHGHKTTINAGQIIPVWIDEALPGDTINLRTSAFARMSTPLKPLMDNLHMRLEFFSVPVRIIWDNHIRMHGEQDDPSDSTDFTVPQIVAPAGGHTELSLADYFGLPTKIDGITHSALFHRAYHSIYHYWYRDQNLQQSSKPPTDDGPDDLSALGFISPKKRCKRHDYFTSCLPWPQKPGSLSSDIPIGTTAPVVPAGDKIPTFTVTGATATDQALTAQAASSGIPDVFYGSTPEPAGLPNTSLFWVQPKLEADLTAATTVTVNALRESFQVQRMYEKDARAGSRYPEVIMSHFSVLDPQFAVLQRPEMLGGGYAPVHVHTVPQTGGSASDVQQMTTPQGNLAAYGTVQATGMGFVKSFTEHCICMGLCTIYADLTYQQGIDRMFLRQTRWDHYYPSLAHLGEQEVTNAEIYYQNTADDDLVFGYQERWSEYRYKRSTITGLFRSNAAQPLDIWHLSQDFQNLPVLNNQFIQEDVPMDRVLATPTEPDFIADFYFNQIHARPMPTFSVPGLIDHL